MRKMFHKFEFNQAHIGNLLIITKGDRYGFFEILVLTRHKIKDSILKYDIEKYFVGQIEMEYLGLWVIWKEFST